MELEIQDAPTQASAPAVGSTDLLGRVLVACEYSGTVREAFAKLRWDAWSCDLLPTEKPGQHYQGDVRDILNEGWDIMVAHPPCTYLTNAGVRHLMSIPSRRGTLTKVHGVERWKQMHSAAELFVALRDADIPHIAVENPIPHRYAKNIIGGYTQITAVAIRPR